MPHSLRPGLGRDLVAEALNQRIQKFADSPPPPPPPAAGGEPPVAGASPLVAECVVPKLKGRKLKAAKKRLRNANSSLGKVKGPKGGKMRKQRPKSGTVLPAGSKVKVTLG